MRSMSDGIKVAQALTKAFLAYLLEVVSRSRGDLLSAVQCSKRVETVLNVELLDKVKQTVIKLLLLSFIIRNFLSRVQSS